MNKVTIIYIAGYGRSGTTVLDLAIGATGDAVSTGELGYLPLSVKKTRMGCSCGNPYTDCHVWSEAAATVLEAQKTRWVHIRNLAVQSLLGFPAAANSTGYANFWKAIIESRLRSGEKSLLIDSSKTAYRFAKRPEALARCPGIDVYVVHVKRSLQGVLKSRKKGKNTDITNRRKWLISSVLWRTRTAVGWWLANRMAERLRRNKWIAGYCQTDYSAFVRDPNEVVKNIRKQIMHWVGHVQVNDFELPASIPVFHLVEGNRLVHEGAVSIVRGPMPSRHR